MYGLYMATVDTEEELVATFSTQDQASQYLSKHTTSRYHFFGDLLKDAVHAWIESMPVVPHNPE